MRRRRGIMLGVVMARIKKSPAQPKPEERSPLPSITSRAGSGALQVHLHNLFRPIVATTMPQGARKRRGNTEPNGWPIGLFLAPDITVSTQQAVRHALGNPLLSIRFATRGKATGKFMLVRQSADLFLEQFTVQLIMVRELLDRFAGDQAARRVLVSARDNVDLLERWATTSRFSRGGNLASEPLRVPAEVLTCARYLTRLGGTLANHLRELDLTGNAPRAVEDLVHPERSAKGNRVDDHAELEREIRAYGDRQKGARVRRVHLQPGRVRVDHAAKVCDVPPASLFAFCEGAHVKSGKDSDSGVRWIEIADLVRFVSKYRTRRKAK